MVEVSLLESTLDLQFEVLTTYLNDGGKLRSAAPSTTHTPTSARPTGFITQPTGTLHLQCSDSATR